MSNQIIPMDSKRRRVNEEVSDTTPKEEISLPVLVLERIFQHVKNPRDLLSCRAVAKLWEVEAKKVLLKRGPDDLVKWNPMQVHPSSNQPILPQLLIPSSETFYFAYYPKGITKIGQQVNPLFTRSLLITDHPNLEKPNASWRTSKKKKFVLINLFKINGDSLTSLSLYFNNTNPGLGLKLDDISKLLGQCPNLVALQIHGEGYRVDPTLPHHPLPDLPKLTRLDCHFCRFTGEWLLQKYNCQLNLLHLIFIYPEALTTERYQPKEGERQPFDKLESLQVIYMRDDFFNKTPISFKLKRLLFLFHALDCTSFKHFIGFITTFKDTLVELSIDYIFPSPEEQEHHYGGQYVAELEDDYHGTFQQLTTFYMDAKHTLRQAHQMNYMKRHFLSKFPNLKELVIVMRPHTTFEEAFSYTRDHDLWAFCSTLEVISFFESTSYRNYRPTYKLYRPTNPY